MKYFIRRGEHEFGPYTPDDIRRYLGTGNIVLTDFAREENGTAWVPVSQVAESIAAPPPPSVITNLGIRLADAPDLHWGIVLVLSALVGGLFSIPWSLVQANWARKTDPTSNALRYFLVAWGIVIAAIIGIFSLGPDKDPNPTAALVMGLLIVGAAILNIVAYFDIRSVVEGAYRKLGSPYPLSGVMTFFFAHIYLQYHLSKIHQMQVAQAHPSYNTPPVEPTP